MSKENAINASPAAKPAAAKETSVAPAKAKSAVKPAVKSSTRPAVKKTASAAKPAATKPAAKKPAAKKAVAKKAAAKKVTARKVTVKKATAKKATAKKVTAKKAAPGKALPAAPVKAPKSAAKPVDIKEKLKKPKLVRDSFTMPEAEYQVLSDVKKAFLKTGVSVKKSELLRAGVVLIKNLELARLNTVIAALAPIKAGRPKKEK